MYTHTQKSHNKLILCFFFKFGLGQEGQDNYEKTLLRLTHFQQSLFCSKYLKNKRNSKFKNQTHKVKLKMSSLDKRVGEWQEQVSDS